MGFAQWFGVEGESGEGFAEFLVLRLGFLQPGEGFGDEFIVAGNLFLQRRDLGALGFFLRQQPDDSLAPIGQCPHLGQVFPIGLVGGLLTNGHLVPHVVETFGGNLDVGGELLIFGGSPLGASFQLVRVLAGVGGFLEASHPVVGNAFRGGYAFDQGRKVEPELLRGVGGGGGDGKFGF